MKKIIFTILTLAIITTSYAQVNFGLRGGLNLSDYSNLESDKKTDLYFGAFLSVKLGNLYTLQPELTYSKEGTKLKGIYGRLRSNTIEANFFSVAVINKFNVAKRAHVVIGPYLDIRMSENIEYAYIADDYSYYESVTNGADIGFIFGLGFDITDSFTIEARYKQGFIDTFDLDYLDGYNNGYNNYNSHLNQVIQLGIAYKFKLRK